MHYPRRSEFIDRPEVPHPDVMLIEAEGKSRAISTQLVSYNFLEPPDNPLIYDDAYRLELSLGHRPKNSRVCYEDAWQPNRYEPVGDVFFVPPQRQLRARSDAPGKLRVVLCELKTESIQSWLDKPIEWNEHRLLSCLNLQNQNIKHLLLRLAEELKHPGFAHEAMQELFSGQLCIELARHMLVLPETSKAGGLSAWRLRKIDERLQEDISAPPLTELAELCGLSVRQLARGFKETRGCSIGTYVANTRIEHAKRMLGDAMSVKAVAYSLGFSSPGSFCNAFRKATGSTPGEYQKKLLL